MCSVSFKVFVGVFLFKISEQVPINIQSTFKFEDDWNYMLQPHNSPMLNKSQNQFYQPIYTFVKDLKVEGIGGKNTIPKNVHQSREAKVSGDSSKPKMSCGICNLGVGLLYNEVKSGTSFDDIKAKFVQICVSFQVATLNVCTGIFDTYGPEVLPVLEVLSTGPIGPIEICKMIYGESCTGSEVSAHVWNIDFPDTRKPLVQEDPLPKVGMPAFKVLQISDTHYDLNYVEGSSANCEEPICCRPYSTPRKGEKPVLAGRWGSYEKCDAPKALLDNMLQHIAMQHPDIDYILWTGDLPPHDIWNQTKDYNLNVIRITTDMVLEAFPDTPIFPAIGNHESSPSGNFAPPWMKEEAHSTSWIYNEIGKSWSRWLPEATNNTVYRGAFYSVLLRPGFRLISVNTNYCHSSSWWLLVNSTDPASELKWLVNELQNAENKGEKVHIIGHIAPGSSDCMKTWSRNFYEIVNRYETTIKALFYGHSHADEFEVFYETAEYSKKNALKVRSRWRKSKKIADLRFTGRPTAVAYLAPSVTSYVNYNPAYRIYYIDGDHENSTREVLDHETWTFDMETANAPDNEPVWYKLYSAKDAYQMESLRAKEWNELIKNMISNPEMFDEFYRNYHRNSIAAPPCDKKCKIQTTCDLKSAKSNSKKQLCNELETAFSNN